MSRGGRGGGQKLNADHFLHFKYANLVFIHHLITGHLRGKLMYNSHCIIKRINLSLETEILVLDAPASTLNLNFNLLPRNLILGKLIQT